MHGVYLDELAGAEESVDTIAVGVGIDAVPIKIIVHKVAGVHLSCGEVILALSLSRVIDPLTCCDCN